MRCYILLFSFFLAFFVNGKDSLSCAGKYDKLGKKDGVWICRNAENKLIRKERFKHGELSTWVIFNTKGQMIESRDKKGRIKKYSPCGC